jgi:hypothetical protein
MAVAFVRRGGDVAAGDRGAHRADTEVDQIRRAGELDREERRLGGHEQRRDARARRQRPARLAGRDAGGGHDARTPAAEQRAADRDSGVGSRRDDDHDRDAEEGEELRHRTTAAGMAMTRSIAPAWSTAPLQ